MKYIILAMPDGRRAPVIFPDWLIHADVAGAIQQAVLAISSDDRRFHERQLKARLEAAVHGIEGAMPVSAGRIALGTDFTCSGGSDTLSLQSRPQDEAIIGVGEQAWAFPDAMLVSLWDKAKKHKEAQSGGEMGHG